MEDNQNERRPKWKLTKMEDDQNGRRDQNGIRPKWKKYQNGKNTKMEKIPKWK